MVATAAGLAGTLANIPAAEYHSHPLWRRYVAIIQFITDVSNREEVLWVTEEA